MEALDVMKNKIEKIIALMKKANEVEWEKYLKKLYSKCETVSGKDILDEIAHDIVRLYGGMGSFNDLVLYKNGKVLIDETNELKELQKKLFKIVTNILASPSNWPGGKPENWEE